MEGNLVRSHRGLSSPLRRMGLLPQYRRGTSSPLRRGAAKRRGGLIPATHSLGNIPRDENAPMPTAPGPRANIVCVGGTWAGSVAPRAAGGTSNEQLPCHCEGVRSTLKTLSYDCGNPVIICLRAFARSTCWILYCINGKCATCYKKVRKCVKRV